MSQLRVYNALKIAESVTMQTSLLWNINEALFVDFELNFIINYVVNVDKCYDADCSDNHLCRAK